MDVRNIKTSITELSINSAQDLVATNRQARRETIQAVLVKKPVEKSGRKKASQKNILNKLSDEEKRRLIAELTGGSSGTSQD